MSKTESLPSVDWWEESREVILELGSVASAIMFIKST